MVPDFPRDALTAHRKLRKFLAEGSDVSVANHQWELRKEGGGVVGVCIAGRGSDNSGRSAASLV